MKLLEKSETGGLDSTSKTIEKWDKFLKKAVTNLGFSQSLIDNMYPYKKGIPLDNGEYLPVDQITGRRFFKMSMADKLAGMLSALTLCSSYRRILKYLILVFLYNCQEAFEACFEGASFEAFKEAYDTEMVSYSSFSISTKIPHLDSFYEKFLKQCTIINIPYILTGLNSYYPYIYTDQDKEELNSSNYATAARHTPLDNNTFNIIYNPLLNNVFAVFPRDKFREVAQRVYSEGDNRNFYEKIKSYDEVYLQDYLCLSLNPIDKLMCSTKQAFSSCMSLARQDDVRGTSSTPALNLPSLFPTDSVFMTFMTPGKHKNMYWEQTEWEKPGEDRDKEKAYKYLKMTCRALTYKGTGTSITESNFSYGTIDEPDHEDLKRSVTNLIKANDKEKLYIGRQYAAYGEDFSWEFLIGYLLHKAGIATNMSLVDELHAYNMERKSHGEISPIRPGEMICKGTLSDNGLVVVDRYGYIRSVYLDNIETIPYDNATKSTNYSHIATNDSNVIEKSYIQVGTCRRGSHGLWSNFSKKDGCDAFKLIAGIQNYTFLNNEVKLCSECGEILKGSESQAKLADGRVLCSACREKLNVKECPSCHKLYPESQADEHKIYNLQDFLNPKHTDELPPIEICRYTLMKCDPKTGDFVICAHCGKQIQTRWGRPVFMDKINIDGLTVGVSLCSDCSGKAVMCDKCKRVIFLENTSDACLLLPNRRVICPDCIDSIRLKQEVKKQYKELFSSATVEDFEKATPDTDPSVLDKLGRLVEEQGMTLGTPSTIIKDVNKQIMSYIKAHHEEGLPKLKECESPLPSDEIEYPF